MPKTGENIYKRKDGRWEARFISGRKPDGRAKYTSVYARTYAAAKAKLEDRKRMIVSRPAGSCRLTVKELFVWYLSQAEIKPSTRARYVFLIEHHILPALGSIFVVSLTANQLSDFLNQKRKSGRLHGGELSAKSVRDIGVLIKAALRFASAEYHFYCDALNTKLPKAKQREIEPFSAWELDQLRKGLSPSPNHKTPESYFPQTEDCGLVRFAPCGFQILTFKTAPSALSAPFSVSVRMGKRSSSSRHQRAKNLCALFHFQTI